MHRRALFAPLFAGTIFCTVFARPKKQKKGSLTDFGRKSDENFGLYVFFISVIFLQNRETFAICKIKKNMVFLIISYMVCLISHDFFSRYAGLDIEFYLNRHHLKVSNCLLENKSTFSWNYYYYTDSSLLYLPMIWFYGPESSIYECEVS